MGEGGNTLIQISDSHKGLIAGGIALLLVTIFMLMFTILYLVFLKDSLKETKTEVRILQMHVQDQNAILIRQGIIQPGDLTTGPTDPDKLKVKKL